MKANLVIDIPDVKNINELNCLKCPLCGYHGMTMGMPICYGSKYKQFQLSDDGTFIKTYEGMNLDVNVKPEWCPLNPIPEKPDYKCGMCEWLKKGNGLYCVCTNGNSNHKSEIRHEYRKACKKGFKLKESENKQ